MGNSQCILGQVINAADLQLESDDIADRGINANHCEFNTLDFGGIVTLILTW